jgi:cytochrome c556
LAQRAHWENSSAKLIEKRIVRNRIEDMRKRKASDLESRKAKLAALLEAEDRMYEKEFNDNLETPEQVRQKMWERLQELKGIREQERQAEVQKRLDMKFKTSNDDLRKEDSQFYNFGTAIEREKQLIDKRRQHEQRMLEE